MAAQPDAAPRAALTRRLDRIARAGYDMAPSEWANGITDISVQIIDHLGRTLAYEDSAEETTAVSALIDIGALRHARRQDTGTANPLIRARWEMYRPFYGETVVYPANAFLAEPMKEAGAARPVAEAALANLQRLGIVTPPEPSAPGREARRLAG